MMTPQALERGSDKFRKGYLDGYRNEPKQVYAKGSFAYYDYEEGYKAGANDKRYDTEQRGR